MEFFLKNNTYKWIIGCLTFIIIILLSYLIAEESGIIYISFSEGLSIASTLSSIILSIIAMAYTYFSGRDTLHTYSQIQIMVEDVSKETKKNSELLSKVKDGIQDVSNAMDKSNKVLSIIENGGITEHNKQVVIDEMKGSQNSMLMFLNRMNNS